MIFDELQGFLGPLLLKRRSGVIAALVAACGRAGVCQKEVCAALAKALGTLPQWQGREGGCTVALNVVWRRLICMCCSAVVVGPGYAVLCCALLSCAGLGCAALYLSIGCSAMLCHT